jgi:hypothetical protein
MAKYNKKPGLPTKGRSIGGSMGGRMEVTKGRLRRLKEARQKEEEYWASLSGPVTVRYKNEAI